MTKQDHNRKYYARTQYAPNHKKHWNLRDCQWLLDREIPDRCLSIILDRSMKAIQTKRSKLIKKSKLMKKIIGLMAMLIVLGTSCKKETVEPENPGFTQEAGENYKVSNETIKANTWLIVGAYKFGSSEVLMWKLKAENSNNYIIINPAPTNGSYHTGDFLKGTYVIGLNIKRQ